MKILLDECVTRKLKPLLIGHDVMTVADMEFQGLKNGKLLAAAQQTGFDVLLTIDKNIDSQQNISKYDLALVIFQAKRSNLKYLSPLVPIFLDAADSMRAGQTYWIEQED